MSKLKRTNKLIGKWIVVKDDPFYKDFLYVTSIKLSENNSIQGRKYTIFLYGHFTSVWIEKNQISEIQTRNRYVKLNSRGKYKEVFTWIYEFNKNQ